MKTHKVSVVIPTRNRYQSLMHSLGSLLTQSEVPAEIIIVDNGSSDQTKKVIKYISKNSNIPIKYVLEKRKGYPFVYNKGLESAIYDWVAFLDDDCIATYNWYSSIVKAINQFSQTTMFLGKSEPLQFNHYLSLTDSFIKNLSLYKIDNKRQILDFEILDSKNTIYNKKFLIDNKIMFDQSLMLFGKGSSEDCDLGMQAQKAGGKAIYEPTIKIYHKEVIDFISYYKKLVSRTRDHLIYERKWQTYRKKMEFKKVELLIVLKSLLIFIKKRKLNFTQTLLLILNVGLSFIAIKTINMVYD